MDWRWGHGRGGAHGGAASGMNRARALGFGGFGLALLRRSGRRARAEEGEGRVKWRVHERVARRWLEVEDNGSGVRPATTRGRTIRDPATCVPHAAPVV